MNLSTELFEQIAASLSHNMRGGASSEAARPGADGAIAIAAHNEQRRDPRVPAESDRIARLIPLTDAIAPEPIDVILRDVAPGGARFLHAGRIPLDEQFVLLLPSTEGPVSILCGVAYWQPVAENLFAIGARFTRVIRQGNPAGARPAAGESLFVRRAV